MASSQAPDARHASFDDTFFIEELPAFLPPVEKYPWTEKVEGLFLSAFALRNSASPLPKTDTRTRTLQNTQSSRKSTHLTGLSRPRESHVIMRQDSQVPCIVFRSRRFGEEASDNARVWRIYQDRAKERDEDQIDGWNKTLDILLIFVSTCHYDVAQTLMAMM
jgi:hypothetical protein